MANASLGRCYGRSTTVNATTTHRLIPAARWCVTARDLKFLRAEVWQGVQTQMIRPDDKDEFDSEDQVYGPSIYTVNEQYIKPVTCDAGKVSWALMRNPKGLDCDLFISHAWQEGIFEFLRKVRHSWPRGVRNAWCCMLANPQNLDIGEMLQTPSDSPFAAALRASKIVLVVPNRHCSVYTRLWCGYEAFLAHEEGKTILIAKDSNLQEIRRAFLRMALAVMVGIVLGLCSRLINFQFPSQVSWFAAPGAALGLCIQHKQVRIFLNLFWEVFSCIELTNIEKPFSWSDSDWWTLPLWARQSLHFLIWLMAAIFFALMEIDRISGESTVKEAQQLRQGYQGSIQYAECARQSDALKIHDEIDCQQDAVDYAIHVLMTAGMSTPALRHVAQAGVDIEFAAYSEITAACIILIPYELVSVVLLVFHTMYFSGEWSMLILQSISIFARLILLLLILWSPQDDQCFALKLLTKLAAVLVIVFAICFLLQWVSDLSEGSFKPTLLWLQVSDIGLLCLIPIASLGIHGTAERLPFGRCLLQLVFARGRKAFAFCGFFQCSNLQPCCCHKYLAPRHSDTESAESSE